MVGALAVVAAVSALAGCDKPQPTITVLSDNHAIAVQAQPVCVILKTCERDQKRVATVRAPGGSQILLDVPKELASGGWIAAAYTTDGAKNTPVSTPGAQSAPIRGNHSVRLLVPAAVEGSYFVEVSALRPSDQLTNWVILVQLTQ